MELSSRKTSFAACRLGWLMRQSSRDFITLGFSCSFGWNVFF